MHPVHARESMMICITDKQASEPALSPDAAAYGCSGVDRVPYGDLQKRGNGIKPAPADARPWARAGLHQHAQGQRYRLCHTSYC